MMQEVRKCFAPLATNSKSVFADSLNKKHLIYQNLIIHCRREFSRKMPPNQPIDVNINGKCATQAALPNYSHFINDFAGRRQPSLVRELNKLHSQKTNDTISLAGGLPNSETFPFNEIVLRLKDGTDLPIEGKELIDSLQYMPTQGYPPLLEWVRDFQKRVHQPPQWEQYDILITPGSQDAISKAIEMSLDRGEPIIVQHPLYSGTECIIKPFGADIMAIEQDQDGLQPDLLRKALEERMTPLDGHTKQKGFPKLLYVNTTGANPTGVALSLDRKREIYRIACEYNLIILEDDPYYFLHFQEEYPTSFLSMDTEGRVLRFDSFSKVISPGIRVGFVTGPRELVRRMELHLQSSSLHCASLSQVLLYKILDNWSFEGLFERFSVIQQFYKDRRDAMVKAAEKHLKGLAEWYIPTAGMFLWIRVHVLDDVRHLVMEECIRRGVMFVTGHAYVVQQNAPCQYLRASFSLPNFVEIDEGMARLAEAIRSEVARNVASSSLGVPNKIYLSDNQKKTAYAKHDKILEDGKLLRGLSEGSLPLRGLSGPLGT